MAAAPLPASRQPSAAAIRTVRGVNNTAPATTKNSATKPETMLRSDKCNNNHAIARQGVPCYLSADHDPLFEFHRWKANLRVLEVDELKTVPFMPTSHPFVERLIGTTRRELLDHVLFWNSVDLESKLSAFRDYYNLDRVHSGIDGATPFEIGGRSRVQPADLDSFRWKTHCRGLYQLPEAA